MSEWRPLYSAVLQLQKHSALERESIVNAEAAILQRSKDLQHVRCCDEERKEMVEAIAVLKLLRRRCSFQSSNLKPGFSTAEL